MISEFDHMWDGHPGLIRAAKHIIQLTSDEVRPIHSALYRSGTPARQFEKAEVDKIFKMKVLEPAQTEWASQIAVAPKKDG